ncbi:MAG: peptide chain release factor 2 [Candidatus Omnitrophota bacterium]
MHDVIVKKIQDLEDKFSQLRGYLDVDNKLKRIKEINDLMTNASFWNNQEEANKIVVELKQLKDTIDNFQTSFVKFKELKELFEISLKEPDDFFISFDKELEEIIRKADILEFQTLLSGEFDKSNAILSINAGAGGTESCDWASMLFRMYLRFAELRGFKTKVIDYLAGEEAGIKNATILIDGFYAYGYLKAERGVHRLVRISPFDSNKRRHTSFASVDVIPEVEEAGDVNVKEEDLRIDVYRASGPGGQGVNTTDSAVRITHLPTGIVVSCQNERSQYQNKQTALKILKARLFEKRAEEQKQVLQKESGLKQKIEWGSQIRSYVMHPYNMVKDHRTDFETGNVSAVMDGKLDDFIEAYLKIQKSKQC